MFHPARSISELLSDVPWVGTLPPEARARLAAETYDGHHRKGDAVVRFGDAATSWIYVADGLLKVSALDRGGRNIMFTGVPTGGWIGEGAVIKREPRRYEISAIRDSRLLHVPATTVHWLLDSSLAFNHAIIAQLNERLSQYITMVEIDRMQDPVARVARSLAVLFNPVLYPNMTAAVPFSQQELGELAGLSRQSISLALRQLQMEGLLSTEYHLVVVKNVDALRRREDGERTEARGCPV